MLTHAALVANMLAGADALDVHQDDVALSFLPLSHAFERMVAYIYLLRGVTIVFAESFDTIGRDAALVKPTVFTGVPRVYEKMHGRIARQGAVGIAGQGGPVPLGRLNVAMARGRATLAGRRPSPLLSLQSALADRLVFARIREGVGGRLRYLVSGSAPLGVSLAEFFHGVGLPIIEGYGLTETAPILTVNPPDAPRRGTVGKPLPLVELRIAADGEILARGPNLMTGYYNKPEATADAIKDGWFHTGDIGSIDADGYLSITDRKKDLLVTSGGKKIAPQPIENVLKQSPLIAEAVVLGDRRKYAAVLLVPEFAALERRLRDLGRPPSPSAGGSHDRARSTGRSVPTCARSTRRSSTASTASCPSSSGSSGSPSCPASSPSRAASSRLHSRCGARSSSRSGRRRSRVFTRKRSNPKSLIASPESQVQGPESGVPHRSP